MTTFLAVSSGIAQVPAYETPFVASVVYQNLSSSQTATIGLRYFNENSGTNSAQVTNATIPILGNKSVYLGNLYQRATNFRGSGVLTSTHDIASVVVYNPQYSSTVRAFPIVQTSTNGAGTMYFATAVKKAFASQMTSVFAVQNVGSGNISTITLTLYNSNGTTQSTHTYNNLPAKATHYFDLRQLTSVGNNFSGSATVTASSGSIYATAFEFSEGFTYAQGFEATSSGASSVFMPTALCGYFGVSSSYAVRNVGTSSTNITITYSDITTPQTYSNLAPNAKASFVVCDHVSSGYSGAAKITTSSGGSVVVVGKAFNNNFQAAVTGVATPDDTWALPFVRWTQSNWDNGTRQRTYLAISNLGTSSVSNVKVYYLDRNGCIADIHTISSIAAGAKAPSNPYINSDSDTSEFGYGPSYQYGGSVIVVGPTNSQLVVLARTSTHIGGASTDTLISEDYTGIAVTTTPTLGTEPTSCP